jgi:hypothetical protein
VGDESDGVVELCRNLALVDVSGKRVRDDGILENFDVVPGVGLRSGSRVT